MNQFEEKIDAVTLGSCPDHPVQSAATSCWVYRPARGGLRLCEQGDYIL